ncbi:MAG: FibroRumin system radical SAM peptide maturase [Synergistaceae bacterium]|nr:FibroRumin system radical SAM peptide maturase [Synergistaceae bacterium]
MKLSDYVKVFTMNDGTHAYYHSLRMIPVYLNEHEHSELQASLTAGRPPSLPQSTLEALTECRILVDDEPELLEAVRKLVPEPYICMAYFILTEQCNLACKYCFLGNAGKKPRVTNYPMSKETAEKALMFFAEQTRKIPKYFGEEKTIIFYGGEALLNFETLRFTVDKCRELQARRLITRNLSFMMVTNGLLLSPEKIAFLRDNNVSVSISLDGADERANSSRIDRSGRTVYSRVLEALRLCISMGLNVSLSVTLTEESLDGMDALITLLQETGINSLCFNILQRTGDFFVRDEYYVRASRFLAEFYRRTKSLGIYEERFMRKLKAFANQRLYFADCGACSGNQIVITPDGQVGICQGCTEDRRYFVTDINHPEYDLRNDSTVREFVKRSPVFREECVKCEALGLCGGGCPVNAPETFCTHAKYTLQFLINELYSVMHKQAQ